MKIKHNRGEKTVTLTLTERLFENKLKALDKAKTSKGASIDTSIKKQPKDVLIIYKWGKSKAEKYEIETDTGTLEKEIPKYYFTSELFTSISEGKKLTKKQLISKMKENLTLNYEAFQRQIADTSQTHPLREIIFKFLY